MLLVELNGPFQGFEQGLACLELGVLVRGHVDLLQLSRRRLGGIHELSSRDNLVEETRLDCSLRIEDLTVDHRSLESRLGQTVPSQFDTRMVHGHTDLYFIEADIERAFDTNAVIRREQQEGAFGNRMARTGRNDRERMSQIRSVNFEPVVTNAMAFSGPEVITLRS